MFVREIFGYLLLIKYYGKTKNIVSLRKGSSTFLSRFIKNSSLLIVLIIKSS